MDERYFQGRITAVQLYDVALNAEQIKAVEDVGQGGNYSETLIYASWWLLREPVNVVPQLLNFYKSFAQSLVGSSIRCNERGHYTNFDVFHPG